MRRVPISPSTVSFVSFYPESCQNTPKPVKLLVRTQIQTGVASSIQNVVVPPIGGIPGARLRIRSAFNI